jgi:hypothetical protein
MRTVAARYKVVRTLGGTGYTDVALVLERPSPTHQHLRRRRRRPDADDTVVLHHRSFRPLVELAELEAYAAQLESAAAHGEKGTLWYFVTTKARRDGTVAVSLFDRWFDGQRLRCEERAHREFDSADDAASTAAGIDFTAELQAWAEQRNDEREARCRDAGIDELVQDDQSHETAAAALELAALLAHVTGRAPPDGGHQT